MLVLRPLLLLIKFAGGNVQIGARRLARALAQIRARKAREILWIPQARCWPGARGLGLGGKTLMIQWGLAGSTGAWAEPKRRTYEKNPETRDRLKGCKNLDERLRFTTIPPTNTKASLNGSLTN